MRSPSRVLAIPAMMALAVAVSPASVVAQEEPTESAPAGSEASFAMLPLGLFSGVTLPADAEVLILRTSVDPGFVFEHDANDPTISFVLVESGSMTQTLDDTAWTIVRASDDGPGLVETVEPGTAATLEAGDLAMTPGNASGRLEHTGTENAESIYFLVAPPGVLAGTMEMSDTSE